MDFDPNAAPGRQDSDSDADPNNVCIVQIYLCFKLGIGRANLFTVD